MGTGNGVLRSEVSERPMVRMIGVVTAVDEVETVEPGVDGVVERRILV